MAWLWQHWASDPAWLWAVNRREHLRQCQVMGFSNAPPEIAGMDWKQLTEHVIREARAERKRGTFGRRPQWTYVAAKTVLTIVAAVLTAVLALPWLAAVLIVWLVPAWIVLRLIGLA